MKTNSWTTAGQAKDISSSPNPLQVSNIYHIQYNLNGSNPGGSFTVDDSNSFFSPYKILPNSSRSQIFRDFFLVFHGIVCCVHSLESPHRGDSNKYTQHTIIVKKIEKITLNYRYLLPELVPWLTLSGSSYPCLERISMVPKMFEPFRFDCMYGNGLLWWCHRTHFNPRAYNEVAVT